MSNGACSIYADNPGCLAVVCYNNWSSQQDTAAKIARDTYCRPIQAPGGVTCGTCTNTTLGDACCQRSDWGNCFKDLARKNCSGEAYSIVNSLSSPSTDVGMSAPATSSGATTTAASSTGAASTSGNAAPSMTSGTSSSSSSSNAKSGGSAPLKVGGAFAAAILALSMVTGTMALM